MKTIGLTSPETKGAAVKNVQKLLKANWTHTNFLQGAVDGSFGPVTARGCQRAKYWLGYPTSKQGQYAGDQLVDYLTTKDNLPLAYRTRRAARLRAAQEKPLREKALERAEKDLGLTESPRGSNVCRISERWEMIGPWCAMAVSEWYIDAGSKSFTLGKDWAYVPWLIDAAAAGQHNLSLTTRALALPGDIVCFDWNDDGVADHTGLLRSTIPAVGTFLTLEGNTAVGDDSNGGEVMHRTRNVTDIARHAGALALIHVGK